MEFEPQENFNKAERDYLATRLAFTEAKEKYLLAWAKAHTVAKTKAISAGKRPTKKDLKYALLEQQSNPDTELGQTFVAYSVARAVKSRMFVEKEIKGRAYWDAK